MSELDDEFYSEIEGVTREIIETDDEHEDVPEHDRDLSDDEVADNEEVSEAIERGKSPRQKLIDVDDELISLFNQVIESLTDVSIHAHKSNINNADIERRVKGQADDVRQSINRLRQAIERFTADGVIVDASILKQANKKAIKEAVASIELPQPSTPWAGVAVASIASSVLTAALVYFI